MDTIIDEVYKPARKPNQYRRVVSLYPNQIWTMDLVFLNEERMLEQNEDYKYVLFVVDVYSRYAFARKLKDKKAITVKNEIISVIEEANAFPEKVWVDKGTEFYNKDLKAFFKKPKVGDKTAPPIILYSTYSKNKASIIERFNRTIKTLMFKQLLKNKNFKWIDILNDIVKKYNNTQHRGIENNTPTQVYKENVKLNTEVEPLNTKPPKFKVGDRVRVSYNKGVFDKSFYPSWSYEIFTIAEVKPTIPYTYIIKDEDNEMIEGSFYENELQKTKQKENVFLVEKILETKKDRKGKITKYLVKWIGYEKPTWEPADNFEAPIE